MSTPREPRLRLRRRLIWGTVVPAIILVVLALRLLTLPVNMGSAREAHSTDDGKGMVSAGEKLDILNIVERWRAPFVEGTGKSIDGDLDGGREDLELALDRTSDPQDDCTVRTNLVITVSQQADAAEEEGDEDATKKLAEEGLELIEEGPEGCLDGQEDGNDGEAGRKQQEEQDKLEEQSGQKEDEGEDGDDGDEGDEGEDEEQQEDEGSGEEEDPKQKELEERNEQGQSESDDRRRQNEADEEGETGGVDKPW